MRELTPIADILEKDLNLSKNYEEPKYITMREAIENGIDVEEGIPIKMCPYCNKPIQPIGLYVSFFRRKSWMHRGEYEKCSCKKAQDYWEKKEAENKLLQEAKLKDEQERAYREKLNRLLKLSKLGRRFENRTFDKFVPTNDNIAAYKRARHFAENFPKYKKEGTGMMFIGSNGTGKTHLAAAICLSLITAGYQPIFGTMITLLDNIKATYDNSKDKESEKEVINKYLQCDLLVIDDLGEEKITDWALEKLYQIINIRYENYLPVVITTNYTLDELKVRLTTGDNNKTASAVVSRLHEMCMGIEMYYDDFRKL